nr:hypothetical protein [Tanacetum cinerariifolium]
PGSWVLVGYSGGGSWGECGVVKMAGSGVLEFGRKTGHRRCRVEQAGYGITDTCDEIVDKMIEIALTTLEGVNEKVTELDTTIRQRTDEDRPDHRCTAMLMDKEAMYSHEACAFSMDRSSAIAAHVRTLETQNVMRTGQEWDRPDHRRTAMLMDKEAMYSHEACAFSMDRSSAIAAHVRTLETQDKNGDNSNDSGTGERRKMSTPRECSYTDFLKCQPMSFQGTKGVVAEHKRKHDDTSRNNQHQQQPFKRNNVAWVYTAGPGDKNLYGGIKPLCPKCNYHYDGPCTQKCTNCRKTGHWARDCKSRHAANNNNNNLRAQGENARGITCFECGVQGPYKNDYPKLKNVKYHVMIVCDEKLVRIPFGDKILIFHGDESNNGNESRLNIISCTKTQ